MTFFWIPSIYMPYMLCSILFFSLRIYTNKTLFKPKLERGITLTKLDTDVHGARELHSPWMADHRGVQVGPDKLEVVASFCLLGDMLSAASGCELSPTTCPVAVTFNHYTCENRLEEVQGAATSFSSRHRSFKTCGHMYSSCVWSTMLHASETWPLTKPNDRAMIRQICNVKPQDFHHQIQWATCAAWHWGPCCSYGHVERSNGAVKTAFDIQVDGKLRPERPKMTRKMTQRDCREWILSAIDPHDRHIWRSGVRSAMHAASQLLGRRPTDVAVGPVLYFCVCVSWMLSSVILFII